MVILALKALIFVAQSLEVLAQVLGRHQAKQLDLKMSQNAIVDHSTLEYNT